MAQVQNELTLLKELLSIRQNPTDQADNAAPKQGPETQPPPAPLPVAEISNDQFTMLEGQIQLILAELAALKKAKTPQTPEMQEPHPTPNTDTAQEGVAMQQSPMQEQTLQTPALEIRSPIPAAQPSTQPKVPMMGTADYLPLTDYFKSVLSMRK